MNDGQNGNNHAQRQEVLSPTNVMTSEQTLAVDLANAEIDRLIATAHKYPRKPRVAMEKLREAVLESEASADRAIYALPRGGKAILGPSIDFANAMASAWGNCWDYGRWIHTDRREKVVVAEGIFVDWESNRRLVMTEQRRIVSSKGQLYSDDMIIVTSKAAAQIARRNVILNAIPRTLWFPIYEKALFVIRGTEQTLPERRDAAMKAMAQFGVDPKQVLLYLDVKDIKDIGIEHMPTLRGMYAQLRDGSATAEEMFDPRRMTGKSFERVDNPLGDDPADDEVDPETGEVTSDRGAKGGGASGQPSEAGGSPAGGTSGPAAGGGKPKADASPSNPSQAITGAPEAKSAAGQPATQENAQATPGSAANAKAADKPARDPRDLAGLDDKVLAEKTGADYLEYLKWWLASSTTAEGADDRYKGDRKIRNNLGTPLTEDQLDAAKALVKARKADLQKAEK